MRAHVLTDEMLSVIWSLTKHEPDWKGAYLLALQERCKLSANNLGEWLCGKRTLRHFALKDMRALESHIGNQVESELEGFKGHTLRNTLREVTLRARVFNSDLPLARFAIEIQRPPNPINPDLYTPNNLVASRELVESLGRAIRIDLEQLNAHGRVGVLLLSAAYYGGLMDIPQLNALIQLDLSKVIWVSQIPETRLSLSIRGQPESEQRQWFPDPTTLALLSRCAQNLAESRPYLAQKDAKLRCIREALSAVGMSIHNLPASLERLFELLQIQRQTQLPQLLMNYATRSSYVTHSVLSDSWQHLHGKASRFSLTFFSCRQLRAPTAPDLTSGTS